MTEEDAKQYINFFDKTSKDEDNAVRDIDYLVLKNLDHLRSFSSTLLSINITVIGAIIAVLMTSSVKIVVTWLVITGLGVLLINTVFLTFYSALVLVGENDRLHRRRNFLKRTFDEALKLAHTTAEKKESFTVFDKLYFSKMKEFADQETIEFEKDKKSTWSAKHLYLFCALFIIGMFLILGGIYPWAEKVFNPLWQHFFI